MEDKTTAEVTEQSAFFGVYDGHGGRQAAELCQENLHKHLMKEMSKHWGETPELRATEPEGLKQIAQCVREAFVACDQQFLCSTQRPRGGTTAVVSLIISGLVVVGNVGDSRAVLCRRGQATPLSHDHTPKRLDEVHRIIAAGGNVEADEVVVNGEEFCLTRAIGDSMVKVPAGYDFRDITAPQVVTSEPELSITEISEDDLFIILASDGVWDRMTNEAAVQFVHHSLRTTAQQDPQLAAQELANHVIYELRSSDNVSIVIILPRKLRQCRPLSFANMRSSGQNSGNFRPV